MLLAVAVKSPQIPATGVELKGPAYSLLGFLRRMCC